MVTTSQAKSQTVEMGQKLSNKQTMAPASTALTFPPLIQHSRVEDPTYIGVHWCDIVRLTGKSVQISSLPGPAPNSLSSL